MGDVLVGLAELAVGGNICVVLQIYEPTEVPYTNGKSYST